MISIRDAFCGGTALLLALLVAGSASAENYRLGSSNHQSVLAIDTDSFHRDGDIVRFDTLMFSQGAVTIEGQPSWATRFSNEINCRTNERRALSITYLAEGGKPITSDPAPSEWRTVPQGGAGGAMRNLICDGLVADAALPFGRSFAEAEKIARVMLAR